MRHNKYLKKMKRKIHRKSYKKSQKIYQSPKIICIKSNNRKKHRVEMKLSN